MSPPTDPSPPSTPRERDLERENERLRRENRLLMEQLRLSRIKRFGPSSEQAPPEQLGLFNEAEAKASVPKDAPPETITVPAHQRAKGGRRPLPEHLDRVEVVHDLDEDQKHCPHDGHALVRIGEQVSEQLDIIPARFRVLRHIRPQYACPHCEQGVHCSPPPPQILPKAQASADLLAHVVIAKYADALPLYRQSQIFKRLGLELDRATLSNWIVGLGAALQPLGNLLHEQLLAGDHLQMDETPVQVLKEPGRKASAKSFMWVMRSVATARPLVLFTYDPSRAGSVPARLLEGFQGSLQTDGYGAYNAVIAVQQLIGLGCWAHARRKFDEALKVMQDKPPDSLAAQALGQIRALYRIEGEIADASPEERYRARQAQALPVLDGLRQWVDTVWPTVLPKSKLAQALGYLHDQWPRLIRYCEDGCYEIDNNACERQIRPFTTGRKNWLFANSVRGAKASALLYSLIESAKANGLDPYGYLRYIFAELPRATTVEAIEALLPNRVEPLQLPSVE
jgi:transposase